MKLKKKSLSLLATIVVAIVASYNVYASHNKAKLSDLALSNIEALAESKESSTCTFGNVSKDQYTNTLHCTGNGTLCCSM